MNKNNLNIKIRQSLLILFTLMISNITLAEEYKFKFALGAKVWDHSVSAKNKNVAFEVASQDCLNYYTNSKGDQKIRVTEEMADALLNTCANPL